METHISASRLRSDIYRIIDHVIETGTPIEVARAGGAVRIIRADEPPRKSRLDDLDSHPRAVTGDPEDLVHLDWSGEWKP